MKRTFLFLTLFLTLTFASFGQTKIDKFIFLKSNEVRYGSNSVTLKIDIGNNDSLFSFKDNSIIQNLKKVEKTTSLIDAFNYLSSLGWTYIEELKPTFQNEYLFCFKKTFDSSEVK